MTDFKIGEKAVYPAHGVAEVIGIENRIRLPRRDLFRQLLDQIQITPLIDRRLSIT